MYTQSKNLSKMFLVLFLIVILPVTNGQSQEPYPTRPITMVVWSTAGMADTVTRIICKSAERELGQPILVENKPGAAGAIAMNYILKSKPDGYTLGMSVTGNYLITPQIIRKVQYNVVADVTDIVTVCKYNHGLCVRADAAWNTFEDIIDYARKNPRKFRYSTAGLGLAQHITMERIAMKEGIKWTIIPFKSGGESVLACLGGHTDATVQGSVDVLPHIRAGKLKMLLSLDDYRWPALPNVPHILEKGFDFHATSYMAYFAPKGLPEPIRQKLESAFEKAKKDPAFVETLDKFQVELSTLGGKEYSAWWRSQWDVTGKTLNALGLVEK